jgi:hypothetical protein
MQENNRPTSLREKEDEAIMSLKTGPPISTRIVHSPKDGTPFDHSLEERKFCSICVFLFGINTPPEPKLKVGDKYNGHQMSPLTLSVKEIVDEYKEATQRFGAFHSAHEGYAVILEELDELKDEVFKQHPQRTKERLRAEAKQVAAMALRFMVDVTS